MKHPSGYTLIRRHLRRYPHALRQHLLQELNRLVTYEPVIGIMGKTGVGKSSLCNALFRSEVCMGFGGELVAHGMRSIARTAAEESGKFRTDVLEAALAHSKKDEIIAAYNRAEYLAERVVLMQWWSDYVIAQKFKAIAA